jgi:hypothetical protein
VVEHLSPDWVERLRAAGADLPERAGASARLQHVVSGAPGGEVAYTLVVEDGRVTAASIGRDDDAADCTLLITHKDAVAIAKGELAVEAGFMQGRVKMTGPSGPFLAVQPVLQSDAYASMVAKVAADTTF